MWERRRCRRWPAVAHLLIRRTPAFVVALEIAGEERLLTDALPWKQALELAANHTDPAYVIDLRLDARGSERLRKS